MKKTVETFTFSDAAGLHLFLDAFSKREEIALYYGSGKIGDVVIAYVEETLTDGSVVRNLEVR